ncbi:MAG: hypothetical protein HYZ53_26855 [Planctomycetes bacterium]|nr:hypothetical protein [Planctomycetota bacterium]
MAGVPRAVAALSLPVVLTLAVAVAGVLAGACTLCGEDEEGRIAWFTDLASARAVAGAQGRPLLVVFR